ncbi:protein ALTERED PHOSPHATE STARVATION RESPONSE 1-like [Mangifera indica]|uniref:protein ALTERED PHOSPHATE STARVATION RESPONSE 1-like n=1 Tax=Mangifera indica TaxID=29780 RepID=UPI001CFB8AA3|nr:protein ALTERED PHOSPHATE STARVATION RESPONSE 1-like [Mangifera indica]XP_044469815.1 protein ALTERED PHOSPHATE STARVATION RESPONSE 1-like [Mangifera indica]XP_044469816.1 protein ALTERED PHOSPHATE STARVATION RESPONSE 1-like [Mangifera indica]XP_044469817.1 protein ALTERED PHOSPHATE STARVATION RESPONSE 1-like [Mangifera indica]XP_044469818.1 protein ALTERED PHOSPHATE STARVATION RESPONSE 1-like [Mangifera indica]XP_044469819.1 protein ALTERED PHOSPHATE STARVATION RESPONSE 1-like [Mangifera i
MGLSSSKSERNEALRLCKARRKFIKQAIDSRHEFAAAHVSYTQSLKNIGIGLRRYAEAEVLIESSLSTTSPTELDKTPSHSSYPSPSPSHINEASDSPLHNEQSPSLSPSPKLNHIAPPMAANVSYMRTAKSTSVTVVMNANSGASGFLEDESLVMPMPPPPPPPFESGSWDFFDPSDESESFRFVGHNGGLDLDYEDTREWGQFRTEGVGAGDNVVERKGKWAKVGSAGSSEYREGTMRPEWGQKDAKMTGESVDFNAANGCPMSSRGVELRGNAALEQSSSKRENTTVDKDLCAEREDPSEFITHRAKDFLSSIKDIEHRFFRASESGKEMSRMLEATNIRVRISEAKGSSSASDALASFHLGCCCGKNGPVSDEPVQPVTKVITWKRTTSSRSSSSRNPLNTGAKDDMSDSGSDFFEDFCMIAGSHASSLDRLYAWEKKLYDEVKASEYIQKQYDQKCDQLRHQFAKDHSTHAIDKTRSVIKDLYSRIIVALQSVDSISRRIEKMRDEELHPQLVELIQGLIRMWKAMLECHHAQYITISLAYHSRSSAGTPQGDTHKQILAQLLEEVECFGLSFADWINSLTSYVIALNGWLNNCILPQQERSKSRKPFSPRRAVAPPIFVLCRDWSAGLSSLPSDELSNEIKTFLSDLQQLMQQQAEQQQEKQKLLDANNGESEGKDDEKNDNASVNLSCLHTSLAKVLDRLNKFSEASLKMYEDIRLKNDQAVESYARLKPARG